MSPRYPSLLTPPVAFFRPPATPHPDEDALGTAAAALEQGATGVEVEVHLTADGDPVIHADATLRTGLRRRPLASLSTSEVPAHVPRLAQLYERCGAAFDLALHVTDLDAVAKVVTLAGEAGGEAVQRLWLCTADWRQAASWREAASRCRLVQVTRIRRVDEGPERRAANLAGAGLDAIRLHESDWNAGMVTLVHRFGLLALAGPAPHQRQLDALLRLGVDGVSSEYAERLAESLTGWEVDRA